MSSLLGPMAHFAINFHIPPEKKSWERHWSRFYQSILVWYDCFSANILRVRKLDLAACRYCDNFIYDIIYRSYMISSIDDASNHILFKCDSWHNLRSRVGTLIGKDLTLQTMIYSMQSFQSKERLSSTKSSWKRRIGREENRQRMDKLRQFS